MWLVYVNRPQSRKWSKTGTILNRKTGRDFRARPAHIPQLGTPETLCGRLFNEQIEVDETTLENMRLCVTCQQRAAKLVQLPRARHWLLGEG